MASDECDSKNVEASAKSSVPARRGYRIPKRYFMVLGMFLLAVLLYVDRACISSSKASIVAELGLTDKQMGWIFSIFALSYALFQLPSGILSDRFGPRLILSGVVTFWSIFTALTGLARGFISMLAYRFLFGAGEAGAYPGCARAVYSWIPMSERGAVQGVTFSGGRFGLAFALPVVAWMVSRFGWRTCFLVLGLIGIAWAVFWYFWFRNTPETHPRISAAEKDHICRTRQEASATASDEPRLTAGRLFGSGTVWLLMWQYFCCNFTFFFCLSWLFPYFQSRFKLEMAQTGFYVMLPPLAGAFGNWAAGGLIDWIYRRGRWNLSRQAPAIAGLALSAGGLIASVFMTTPLASIAFLSIAIFGADMTLAPSWTVCIDIGRRNSGTVSSTMNMAGNFGSFVTSLAFPYLLAWTGTNNTYFIVGAVLNVTAIAAWLFTRSDRHLGE